MPLSIDPSTVERVSGCSRALATNGYSRLHPWPSAGTAAAAWGRRAVPCVASVAIVAGGPPQAHCASGQDMAASFGYNGSGFSHWKIESSSQDVSPRPGS